MPRKPTQNPQNTESRNANLPKKPRGRPKKSDSINKAAPRATKTSDSAKTPKTPRARKNVESQSQAQAVENGFFASAHNDEKIPQKAESKNASTQSLRAQAKQSTMQNRQSALDCNDSLRVSRNDSAESQRFKECEQVANLSYIPYGRQDIADSDIAAVAEILRAERITQGPKAQELENAIAQRVGAPYAVSFNSATSALHSACLALGLKKGDYLWTSPISFVASANCGIYCGAKVDFVDINPQTYNLCPEALAKKLAKTPRRKLPKVLVCVHFAGQSCHMEAIHALSLQYGFRIIEDASHALGGSYCAHNIGDCAFSDISIFSFHPVKIITTAEGGIATCKDLELAQKMQRAKAHGITHDPARLLRAKGAREAWYYEQQEIGFNYRLSELHAALGLSQLPRLLPYVARRNERAMLYNEAFADLELTLPYVAPYNYSAFHLYVIVLNKHSGISRRALFDCLRAANIGVQVHYIPIHLQPFYAKMGFKKGDFKNAESYYKHALSLPLFPTLSNAEQQRVIDIIRANVARKKHKKGKKVKL